MGSEEIGRSAAAAVPGLAAGAADVSPRAVGVDLHDAAGGHAHAAAAHSGRVAAADVDRFAAAGAHGHVAAADAERLVAGVHGHAAAVGAEPHAASDVVRHDAMANVHLHDVTRGAAAADVVRHDANAGAARRAARTNARPARPRTMTDFLRKLGAVLLVLASATVGLIGLGTVVGGMGVPRGYGVPLLLAMPVGIWFALLLTPEGGTSGYCDQNI